MKNLKNNIEILISQIEEIENFSSKDVKNVIENFESSYNFVDSEEEALKLFATIYDEEYISVFSQLHNQVNQKFSLSAKDTADNNEYTYSITIIEYYYDSAVNAEDYVYQVNVVQL